MKFPSKWFGKFYNEDRFETLTLVKLNDIPCDCTALIKLFLGNGVDVREQVVEHFENFGSSSFCSKILKMGVDINLTNVQIKKDFDSN